jgi:Ran GTPase-activating protein (RanGAP) involved in mRNA processing and transport
MHQTANVLAMFFAAIGHQLATSAGTEPCRLDDIGLTKFQTRSDHSLVIPVHCAEIDLRGFCFNSSFGDTIGASLAELLKDNTVVTSVNLRSTSAGDVVIASLAEAFKLNTAITTLDLSSNNFGIAGVTSLAEALAVNGAITAINLCGNRIENTRASCLAKSFAVNTVIQSVKLCNNDIWADGGAALFAAFAANSAITSVDLSNNHLNDAAAALAEALVVNTAIAVLDLSQNHFTASSTALFAEVLKVNTGLRSLNLSNNGITFGDAGTAAVAEALEMNHFLTVLDLSGNYVWTEGARLLAEMLKLNTALISLILTNNIIDGTGAAYLADALKTTKRTRITIDLDSNRIGAVWTNAIEWLTSTAHLRSVRTCSGSGVLVPLSGECQCSGFAVLGTGSTCAILPCFASEIGLPGFQGGINILVIPPSCHKLELTGSNMVDLDAVALASIVSGNFAITSVDLSYNLIGPEGAFWLAKAFAENYAIQAVGLNYNHIGDLGAVSLAKALTEHAALTTLGLGSNNIGDSGASVLAKMLIRNLAIVSVDLSNNNISDRGAAAILMALETRGTFAAIDVRDNRVGDELLAAIGCYMRATNTVETCSRGGRSTNYKAETTAAVAAMVVVASVVLLIIVVQRQRRRHRAFSLDAVAAEFVAITRERAEARFVLEFRQLVTAKSMPEFRHEFQELEVPRSHVTIGTELGRGQFGVVFGGKLSNNGRRLAIKKLHSIGVDFDVEASVANEALMLEAMVLNALRHPGIVTLLAVVTTTVPALVCTELLENGDLREYLRRCRPQTIAPLAMYTIAAKLSSAFAFLEQRRIIHRDIAARNVLVGKDSSEVKVADLGAARSVHRTRELVEDGVYIAKSDHSPVRWMSVEALREAKFSHASDVFAFGVLLWEILSLGQTPWGALCVTDFTQALENGERLKFPRMFGPNSAGTSAANALYLVAIRCWEGDSAKRPHFHQLEAEFAIHLTVTIATKAGLRQNSERGGCDYERSVADTAFTVADNVHARDGHLSNDPPLGMLLLDADGYVADDAPLMMSSVDHTDVDVSGGDSAAVINQRVFKPNSEGERCTPYDEPPTTRKRVGSLYLGFEQQPTATVCFSEDETRL